MIEALLTLKGDNASGIGRERIRLLEAVEREGSITGAARAVGLTYKSAWEALNGMAQLFGCALLETRVGGRTGGGARLTPAGTRLVAAFGRLETDLARATRRLDAAVASGDAMPPSVRMPLARTSARNTFRGTVAAIQSGALTAGLTIALPEGDAILARVTGESLRDLGLVVGGEVTALVKASFVALAPAGSLLPPGRVNLFEALVRHCAVSGADAESVLDIGQGRSLAVTTTAKRVDELRLEAGRAVQARFAATQVILAV